MAAYAALVSLEHIIHNLLNHSRPPISLHKEQAYLLTEKVTFLQEFLQLYNPTLDYTKEADPLESRIARAAYAAEDAIESHIYDHFTNNDGEKMSSDGLYAALEKVIEDMALIQKEAMEINKETTSRFHNQLHAKSTTPVDPSTSSTEQKKSRMVGADDLLLQLKDKLTSHHLHLQTIPIVGMGGSGKTTLALTIYQDALIKEHFDIRAWITISQEYIIVDVLRQLLTQLIGEPNKELSEGELGEILHKHLYGRKYMIVLDDVWSLTAWDGIKRFLPNNKNGSRIVITTRITTLASALPNSNSLAMELLDEGNSWDLLSKTVFGDKGCPLQFEIIGKKIGRSCKGLPLSIVVVGGLLAKSEQSIQSWENMEGNLNAIVNLEDDERCLKILYMSYKQLPVHLKPCFLYMGIYSEDHVIRVSNLVKLWVAEGFLKPASGKSLEEIARAYIKDLTERNLILVHAWGSIGNIKLCRVHDLLRDLCLREAQKEGFYTVSPGHEITFDMSRIVISGTIQEIEEIDTLSSLAPLARSLIFNNIGQVPPRFFKLMRTVRCLYGRSDKFLDNVHHFVNLRLTRLFPDGSTELIPDSIWGFWNLHALDVYAYYKRITFPSDIWYMSHIRHLYIYGFHLPDPPPNVEANGVVLANLQSLGNVHDFTCSEQMVKRLPNIRKLLISYEDEEVDDEDRFRLTNLDCLDKLKSLDCRFERPTMCLINYPHSLKKLSMEFHKSQCWQDILDKIGALPLLQKLNLCDGSFKEGQWETSEGQFRSLKFLSLWNCDNLELWTSEDSHFPRLEQLHLSRAFDLKEIPLEFADISTLGGIDVEFCSNSAVESAKRILEEQEALYGEEETTLQVRVLLSRGSNDPSLASLKSPNFHVSD